MDGLERWKKSYDEIAKRDPLFARRFYPRKLASPTSHYSPKAAAGALLNSYARIHVTTKPSELDGTNTAMACLLALNHVPTLFVEDTVLHEARNSSAESSISLEDLHWPFEAILFVMPVGELPAGNARVAFIAIVNRSSGTTYPIWKPSFLPHLGTHLEERTDLVSVSAMMTDGVILHLDWPPHKSLKNLLEQDEVTMTTGSAPLSHDEDALTREFFVLAIKLILIGTARPDFVSEGRVLAGPGKTKKLSSLDPDNLYEPSWLRIPHETIHRESISAPALPQARHLPRFHLRKGHFRSQSHGPGHALRKILWIRPTVVGSPLLPDSPPSQVQ